jgi:hypothetical protein
VAETSAEETEPTAGEETAEPTDATASDETEPTSGEETAQ